MTMISASAVLIFAAYVATGAVLVVVFVLAYEKCTTYREFELIKSGNVTAAISIVAAMTGFSLPSASVMMHALSLDIIVQWSVIALVAQFAAYLIAAFVLRGIQAMMNEGNIAAGTFLGGIHLTTGILIAAGMVE